MLFRTVDTQALGRDFELGCRVPEAQEGKDPHEDADRVSLEVLERSHIHRLRAGAGSAELVISRPHTDSLIPQPVSKIYALDHSGGPFVTSNKGDCFERILDVTMAPVLSLDCRDGGDIYCR